VTSSRDHEKGVVLVGLLRLREHCTFTWREPQAGGRRSAEVRSTHCEACVAELRRLGYDIVSVDAGAE
jgi:hypothetical protein